ncbi:unnamed protein product [Symbiodinium necroappetens]|uniref:Helitron helicase-like domain-containing protein n=1 Tax=Symbiodinium necroappetens TaxID=1628268 RepID=A0A812IMR5_9DINO|nr:unnamed protein product [Symbiodinium necroappetens]
MLVSLQENLRMLEEEAAKVGREEAKKRLEDGDGAQALCTDVGGREVCKQIAVDIQAVAQRLGPQARLRVEEAIRSAEVQQSVSPQGLAVPTNEPLSFFDAGTWPACFTEFLYGDGCPGLKRDAACLFEQLFAYLLDRQELEYTIPGEEQHFRSPRQNRFSTPEMIAVFADVRRRLALLSSTRATISRPGFAADLKLISEATPADFVEAMGIAGKDASLKQVAGHPEVSKKLKAVLRSLSLSTANICGTEGRKTTQRHIGNSMNIVYGPCSLFVTMNFADTRSRLVYQLHGGGLEENIEVELWKDDPAMPSLRDMHRLVACDPRAQAKFFLLMMELHVRHVLGLDDVLWGKRKLCSPSIPGREDSFAASLRPCLLPYPVAAMGPGESQERGFEHAHLKIHGFSVSDARRIKEALLGSDVETTARLQAWRQQGLQYVESVLQESATATARSLDLHLPPVGFSREQQRQTRFDGLEEEDGSKRLLMPVVADDVDGHVERENAAAAAEQRAPRGPVDIPLTGSVNSSLPTYRLPGAFGRMQKCVNDAVSLDCPDPKLLTRTPWRQCARSEGKVTLELPDGRQAQDAELLADAAMFEECFARDTRRCFFFNQMHRCVESCVKYSKSKQSRSEQVAKSRAPLCRARFYHIVEVVVDAASIKRKRRRGKRPREAVCVDEDVLSETYCKVCLQRDHPFISVSSDVMQVCARCNVDCQYLELLPTAVHLEETSTKRAWWSCLGIRALSKTKAAVASSLLYVFRQMHHADFYITKYVAKPLQSMKPILEQFSLAMVRLEAEIAAQPDAAKRRKLDPATHAKRTLLKLAHAGNRCFWQSATELCTILLTGGDMLQTHVVQTAPWLQESHRVFFKQVSFMACKAKELINTDIDAVIGQIEENTDIHSNIGQIEENNDIHAVIGQIEENNDIHAVSGSSDDEAKGPRIEIMSMKTTNAADDYAHRGAALRSFHFLGYQMYVRRVPLRKSSVHQVFPFEPHYALASRYGQEVRLKMAIPRLCNFRCPSMTEDPEGNAMMKGLLFQAVACPGPNFCHHVMRFQPLLGAAQEHAETIHKPSSFTFESAWRVERARVELLARRADRLEEAGQRLLVLHDTTLLKAWLPPEPEQHGVLPQSRRQVLQDLVLARRLPERTAESVASFLCAQDLVAGHVCPCTPDTVDRQVEGHLFSFCTSLR